MIVPKTLIISRTDNLGDVILTLPLAGRIKKQFPDCKIIFLGKSYSKPITNACQHIDDFLNWHELEKLSKNEQTKTIKNTGADTIIHVFPNKRIAQLASNAKIKNRIGTSHRLFHRFYCNKLLNIGRKQSDLHESQLNLKFMAAFGITDNYGIDKIPQLYGFNRITPPTEKLMQLYNPNRFNLIIHPKSKGSAREWGLDNFEKLLEILPEEKFKVFVTGTGQEGELMADFLKKNEKKAVDLTGKMTLPELISFIKHADGLIAASTGPLHIASACGIFTLGLFAPMRPIHPGRWAPIGNNADHLVLNKTCKACKNSTYCECIASISPKTVKDKILNHIASAKNE